MARILVVDDQPDTLLEMRIVLESAGHEPVLAADSDRAAERLASGPVDVVLVDVAMPTGDGWAVLTAATRAKVPVIIVTSRATPAQLKRAAELGATAHVPKSDIATALVAQLALSLPN
jgi:CheY-like chemotaxis protein